MHKSMRKTSWGTCSLDSDHLTLLLPPCLIFLMKFVELFRHSFVAVTMLDYSRSFDALVHADVLSKLSLFVRVLMLSLYLVAVCRDMLRGFILGIVCPLPVLSLKEFLGDP